MGRLFALTVLLTGYIWAGLLLVDGGVLALALPLLLFAAVAVLFAAAPPNLHITRELSAERLPADATLRVTLRVVNRGRALPELHLRDSLPHGLTLVDGATSLATALPAGGELEWRYEVRGPRGAYHFAPVAAAVCDPFGLLWQRTQVTAEGASASLILQPIAPLGPIALRPRQTRAFAGSIPARIAGSGSDFHSVRAYRQGDPLRRINWRAAARHPEDLFTNAFEQERVADVGLIVDARRRSVTRLGRSDLLEHNIAAAAAFTDALIRAGHRVSLLIYGNYLDWTLPGYGKVQRQRILETLSATGIGDSQVFDNLENLPTRLFPAQSQLIVFSPLLPDDAPVLQRMRARGYAVLLISPDPVAFEATLLPETPATQTAVRIAQIERRLTLRRLRRAGVQTLNWPPGAPLEQLVRARLQRPPVQPGGRWA